MIAEQLKNDIDFKRRRLIWKQQNSARSRELAAQIKIWSKAIRDHVRAFADGLPSSSIDSAMMETHTTIGQKFARAEKARLLRTRNIGADTFAQDLERYVTVELGAATASIKRTTNNRATKIFEDESLTEVQRTQQLRQFAVVRGSTLANEETTRASNYGQLLGAEDAAQIENAIPVKIWVATLDNAVRDGHDSADGQLVTGAEPFIVAGEQLQYPQDPAGSPGNTINCRCVAQYELKKR